jgi:hypothetical protein
MDTVENKYSSRNCKQSWRRRRWQAIAVSIKKKSEKKK